MTHACALSRRALLGSLAAGGALAALPGIGRFALAGEPQERCLVVLFLRGGADGLMLVGPSAEAAYIADRPPEMRVLDSGDRKGLPLDNALNPRLDFRLHSELGPLAELYQAKQLAIVHAAGITDGTRSHFVAQDLIERGVAAEGDLAHAGSGWLTRLLGALPPRPGELVRAVCTSGAVDASLAGFGPALAAPDLNGGIGLYGGDPTRDVLAALYRTGDDPLSRSMRSAVGSLAGLDQRLRGPDGKVTPYQPENQASYDGAEAGRGLRVVAQLLKLEVGLTLAAIDMGGWDTHEGQPGRFANQSKQLGLALAAFWNDIARYHDRVTLVAVTEFGRRLRSNLSQGTDHGHAAPMLVLGGTVNGGRMYGRWPGLDADALDHGVDLAVTTDYRTVFAEIAQRRFGVAPGTVFPGFTPPAPLGLLRA